MSGGTLSQESVLREQAKDKFCAKIKPGNYSSKCEFFRDDVGANTVTNISCLYLKLYCMTS